jgi:hypothetical protein
MRTDPTTAASYVQSSSLTDQQKSQILQTKP